MSGGIYKRGENFCIDFTFKGKRIRETIGPSRKIAEAVIAKRKVEILEHKYLDVQAESKPVSFHSFGVEYIAWSKANKKPNSVRQNVCQLRRLESFFKDKNIQDISLLDLERWKTKRKEMVKVRGKGKGQDKIGKSCLNGELRLLKGLFSKAVVWGRCKENVAKGVKLLKGENQRTRFLSLEEIEIFLANCTEPLKTICTIILHTGLRKSEILGLKWSEINFDQNLITVLDSKNHEVRRIPMNETVQGVLRELPHHGGYVFSQPNGKKYFSVQKAFDKAKQASGIIDISLHTWRHTFASYLVMENVDLTTIMYLLGHHSLQMVLRYSHLSPQHKSHAVNVLDSLMAQKTQGKKKLAEVISLNR